eukprot:jgi/Mesvir1/24080/Mv10802-RA.1
MSHGFRGVGSPSAAVLRHYGRRSLDVVDTCLPSAHDTKRGAARENTSVGRYSGLMRRTSIQSGEMGFRPALAQKTLHDASTLLRIITSYIEEGKPLPVELAMEVRSQLLEATPVLTNEQPNSPTFCDMLAVIDNCGGRPRQTPLSGAEEMGHLAATCAAESELAMDPEVSRWLRSQFCVADASSASGGSGGHNPPLHIVDAIKDSLLGDNLFSGEHWPHQELLLGNNAWRQRRRPSLSADLAGAGRLLFGADGTIDNSHYFNAELLRLGTWNLDVWELDRITRGHPLVVIMTELLHREGLVMLFGLDTAKAINYFSAVERSMERYRNPFHNRVHVADVVASMYYLLRREDIGGHLQPLHVLAALIAAAVHDFKHKGKTNDYLVRSKDRLAHIYNGKSVNENFHACAALALLEEPQNFFLSGLTTAEFCTLKALVVDMRCGAARSPPPAPRPAFCKDKASDVTLLLQMLLKLSDLGHSAKQLPIHLKYVMALEEEFYRQGDEEAAQGMSVSSFMDRSKPDSVVKSQVSFFRFLSLPMFEAFAEIFPACGASLLSTCKANLAFWESTSPTPLVTYREGDWLAKFVPHSFEPLTGEPFSSASSECATVAGSSTSEGNTTGSGTGTDAPDPQKWVTESTSGGSASAFGAHSGSNSSDSFSGSSSDEGDAATPMAFPSVSPRARLHAPSPSRSSGGNYGGGGSNHGSSIGAALQRQRAMGAAGMERDSYFLPRFKEHYGALKRHSFTARNIDLQINIVQPPAPSKPVYRHSICGGTCRKGAAVAANGGDPSALLAAACTRRWQQRQQGCGGMGMPHGCAGVGMEDEGERPAAVATSQEMPVAAR